MRRFFFGIFMYTKFKTKHVLKFMSFWPPYFGAGVKVKVLDTHDLQVLVSMNLKFTNKNMFGTHFGGSLYTMVDPFFTLILFEQLNKDYLVWDKEASIKFKTPGKGVVSAHFQIDPERVEEIKSEIAESGKAEPEFRVDILDEKGTVVAEVTKMLWARKKS